MSNPHKEVIPEELFYTILAADEDANDAPDGAWWAMLEDTVKFWNRDRGTSLDEHETVHQYLQWCKSNNAKHVHKFPGLPDGCKLKLAKKRK